MYERNIIRLTLLIAICVVCTATDVPVGHKQPFGSHKPPSVEIKEYTDAFNQMNCLLNGTKQWKLIEPKYEKFLYKQWEPEQNVGGFSKVNPPSVDLLKQPDVAKIEWSNITIHAGDCIFLPKSYYHQVDSFGSNNLAVSILFRRFDDREMLDFSDCTDDTDYHEVRPLSDFDVSWIWQGAGTMVMGGTDMEYRRKDVLELARECETTGTPLNLMVFEDAVSKWEERRRGSDNITGVFESLDKNKDGELSEEEIKNWTLKELRYFLEQTDRYEPSNSYNYEYSIISHNTVLVILKYALGREEKLKRETWVKLYKYMGGTEGFGDEIFTRLAGSKPFIITKEITNYDISYALENWRINFASEFNSGELVTDYERMKNENFDDAIAELRKDLGLVKENIGLKRDEL